MGLSELGLQQYKWRLANILHEDYRKLFMCEVNRHQIVAFRIFLCHSLYVVMYKMRRRLRILFRILYVASFRTFTFSHFAFYTGLSKTPWRRDRQRDTTHTWMVDGAVQSIITATWRVTVRHTNVWMGDGTFRCVIRTTWQPALLYCWSDGTGNGTAGIKE